jgi:Uma2 family endonuclease
VFHRLQKAGVREYWIVEPDVKIVSAFILQENGRYGRPEIYTEDEKIEVSIFPDLIIDLNSVFGTI